MMRPAWVSGLILLTLTAPAAARDDAVRQGSTRSASRGDGSANTKAPKTPKGLEAPDTKRWFDDGMAAIRDKNPGRAVAMMQPLLDDFEKRYAGEKRHIYCALNPAQSKAYGQDAAKDVAGAVTIEPDWCRAQYVKGYALIELGKTDEALAAFQHLTDQAPRNSRYLNELAYVLADKKKYADAVAIYRRSVEAADLSPDGVDEERCIAYRGLGYNLSKLGRLGDAETAYRACLAIEPDNEDVQDALDGIEEDRKQTV